MNFGSKIGAQKAPFPMAAMIDILFLLLVFFMTTSIFAQFESEIDISVPKSAAGKEADLQLGEIIINVTEDGKFKIGGQERPLTRAERTGDVASVEEVLKSVSRAHKQAGKKARVIIRGAEKTEYDNIVKALTQCKNAEIENVSFSVRK